MSCWVTWSAICCLWFDELIAHLSNRLVWLIICLNIFWVFDLDNLVSLIICHRNLNKVWSNHGWQASTVLEQFNLENSYLNLVLLVIFAIPDYFVNPLLQLNGIWVQHPNFMHIVIHFISWQSNFFTCDVLSYSHSKFFA